MKTVYSTVLTLFYFLTFLQFAFCQTDEQFADFIPEGYVLFEKSYGDLNKDGQEDCILIVKGTDKKGFAENQFGDIVDKNRRGIIVLFHTNDRYEPVVKNLDCFSSENEDGGVYYAPELSANADKGNLYVHYAHGRYGYWTYTFRYQNNDFELIGFDASQNYGPIVNRETSINFSTQRKLERVNVNEYTEESGDEVFEETWYDLAIGSLSKLSQIEDFDSLNMARFKFGD